MATYQQNRRARAFGHEEDSGKPIPGDKSAACLARIARRKQVRARRKEFAATLAKQRAALVPNKTVAQ